MPAGRSPLPTLLLLSLALACQGVSGCASFWDDVTSRDFNVKWYFQKPDPLVVLRDSHDGDLRRKALAALREPKQYGGTDEQQDVVVEILKTAASNERQVLCRIAAIGQLAQFKDPRAVDGLKEAYYRATSFSPDQATIVRCQALRALGETHQPAAVDLLVKVVKEPPVAAEDAEQEKQQRLQERIAAARALRNFKDFQAVDALVGVLRTEPDVALRDNSNDSLRCMTGKMFPADAEVWAAFLQQTEQQRRNPFEPTVTDKMLQLANFWWQD
jgi:HEAT repeat protein